MTLLYTDPLFLKHETGRRHPETATRLRSVTARLEKAGLIKKCAAGTYKPLTEEVAKAHARGRLVSCLEGGYNVETLAECVQVHLEELLAFQG